MHLATISSKFQISIPKRLLEELGVGKKQKLLLDVEKGKLIARPVKKSIIDSIAGSVTISNDKRGKSFQEIMKATRRKVARSLAAS